MRAAALRGLALRAERGEALAADGRWNEAEAALVEAARLDPSLTPNLHALQDRRGGLACDAQCQGHCAKYGCGRPGRKLPLPVRPLRQRPCKVKPGKGPSKD